ncbi:dihydrolipoyl dehydrogenase [Pseudomonas gingeri]|uniref:Dihydrolipoyl dehydrogenase n=1 Tax=Pseudomonas gingeri TaxID=117681 RepID=A0A7Y8CHG1_9PSED|nr:dihydrolipoyl dehydrogenase [Pseudomonas gingeri]NWA04098.1 dihydrolipoyl dehydrogenase [Pseudomonas gingeri]NWA15942.1 dihydrolipoyl dehydrogenase [Pseudomonas gingeri]NWA58322.1 dihydrolipoyl dehydrogenase [Pseudomonas gingeri]NWA99340.1 dihydrolipoyl dehydrogenase [Pseudomonas gingeri]NWB05875.1 dihydrolipoyl dehydrogenase [Pseudomonas gingeri]
MSSYDVIIIGGGPGGYNAAIRAGQLGLKAACIEGRETLGGTCLNVGCMPSKALLHASELYEAAVGGELANLGIEVTPSLNLAQMMKQKDNSVAGLTQGIEYLFRKNKVEWIKGWGHITGPGQVEVTNAAGHKTLLQAKDIVIATGSEPTPLPGVAIDNQRILDSTGALSLPQVPRHLVVIGAGVIGLELGSVWRRLGSQVTVVEYLDRICPGVDAEAGKTLQRALAKQGIGFKLGTRVTRATTSASAVQLRLEPAAGGEGELIEADYVLVAIGRRPFTRGLGLENVGLTTDPRGLLANRGHRTEAAGIWVIGDVTSGPMLAHKAEDEAMACIEQIVGKAGEVNYALIPSVIYTRPELASVGKTEEQLKAEGRAYKVGKFPFSANSRAKINHETEGFAKVLADAQTDEILGVHLVGPSVSEMIGEYCVAMEFSASAEDIALTCHPHPTRSEALRQAAMNVEGLATQI